MQTKSSYRVLKWALVGSVVAAFATACVVKEGDPDIDFGDGGDGNTSTAGETSSGGKATGGGGSSTGGSSGSGGKATAGTSQGGDAAGGEPSTYVPGECQDKDPTPTSVPSCDPGDNDTGKPCKICLKAKCCETWQTCYGDTPTSACGWGTTEEAPGQFDCVQQCYAKGVAEAVDFDALLDDCQGMCLNQCENVDDGFITDITNSLLGCAQDNCADECFPVE